VNDSLARENAGLRAQLKTAFYVDTIAKHKVNDTIYK
jgi:rod shape-determining protein MreC